MSDNVFDEYANAYDAWFEEEGKVEPAGVMAGVAGYKAVK